MQTEQIQKTLRAITNQSQAKFHFLDQGGNIFSVNKYNLLDIGNLHFPKNQIDDNLKSYADLGCCYFLFHDKNIDQNLLITSDLNLQQKELFDDLEKIRIFLISRQYYLGIFRNIFIQIQKDLSLVSSNDKKIILQVLLIGKYLVKHKIPIDEFFEEVFYQTNQNIKQNILQLIDELIKDINNQKSFGKTAISLIESIDQDNFYEEEKLEKKSHNQQKNNKQNNLENPKEQNQEQKQEQNQNIENQAQEILDQETKKSDHSLDIEQKSIEEKISKQQQRNSSTLDENKPNNIEFYVPYKVYTSTFDEIIHPEKIIPRNELLKLSELLDKKFENLENISRNLRLQFRKKLLSKQNISQKQSLEEGIIDRKKLSQIIASPFKGNFYITHKNQQYQNTTITILLDNSGSMRGSPIVIAALACQIIAQLLEEFSIRTEILGFTTADWRGGKSKQLWTQNNSPANPGRLNDLRHIIYKSANQSFSKSKANLGLMLKEGILKENIDGEAILWAKSRLMQMPQERKILMVICDGTPVDDPTNSNNDKEILIDHLNHVINRIEKDRKIELVGIGIGHDVTRYYQNSITIKKPEELGDVMIKKIIDLV